ncbi:MAG: sugar ABC transporter permease [Propionibacteriaceae bacterium]|jgi:multiple sugar transport system permease protein|nr:sugar ABC transporter permease [Propionibacteriaceae bacterium]
MAKGGVAAERRRPHSHLREATVGYAFILPALVGIVALYLFPLIKTAYLSFTKTGVFGDSTFIGGANYANLVTDPTFGTALRSSAIYTVIVLLAIPISIVIAALIAQVRHGATLYRIAYFLPVVTLPVAVGMVWRFIYNGDFGLLNALLSLIGIDGKAWVADPTVAIFAVSAVGIWTSLGTAIIILGAGLQGIPQDLYEAASLDGAGPLRQFRSITLPLLTPSIFFVSVLSVIGSLQMFDLIYVMIGRNNPALSQSQTIVYLFYQKAFVEGNRGYGAAIAIALLLIIMALTAIQFRLQKRWVFYG